ncbi:MAG: hypothetical protein PVG21_08680, partial [Gammaproteobacteria bacterium]
MSAEIATTECLDRQRRQALFWFGLTYALWQGGTLVGELLPGQVPGWLKFAATTLTLLGALAWGLSYLRLLRHQRRVRARPEVAGALFDERFRLLRLRSFVFGFWALLAWLVVAQILIVVAP